MAVSKIRWKHGDYIKLGRAVSDFNKKINELQQEENKLYLPTPLVYNNVKENITTRAELNRMINSLRRFQEQDAGELYVTESGEQLTKWERRELGRQVGIAKRRLNKELASLNEPSIGGFSRVQMGSVRAREIEAQIKSLGKLETKTGFEFNRLKKSIRIQGASDYSMKKSIVFRENFLNELSNLSKNSKEFEGVYNYFKNITNPIDFFEKTQKSNVLQDFFQWYKNPNDYLASLSAEELANYIINEYE